jgi:Sulfotransferase family
LPSFRGRTVFQVAQDWKAFLHIDAGITRGELPDSGRRIAPPAREGGSSPDTSIVRPENIVWTFGSAWSDSAWLGSMMGISEGTVWNRPLLGDLFGDLFYVRAAHRRDKDFVLGGPEETRSKLIRAFILSAVEAKFPRATHRGYLVVNEPGGSLGAPLLAQALPESRLILLVRHPGDVIASALRASGESDQLGPENGRDEGIAPFEDPDFIVANQAARYFDFVGNARRAYEEHAGPKVLVRYEDLCTDTLGTMRRIHSELGMAVDEGKLSSVVERHSGGSSLEEDEEAIERWRESLTGEQAALVEKITAPLLEEFYSG